MYEKGDLMLIKKKRKNVGAGRAEICEYFRISRDHLQVLCDHFVSLKKKKRKEK